MNLMPSARERHLRNATRRSWTGSGAKLRPALSHSSSTRSIQCLMPNCRSCGATDEGSLIRRKCMVTYLFPSERCNCSQNSKYPRAGRSSVPVAANSPSTPRRVSQAAWFSAGSELTRSRIICQAAMLRAPSGGGPIAKDTEHCGQKQIRRADDFCRGRIPTVCANMYTATDLCPASSSRLQRRQYIFSKGSFLAASSRVEKKYCLYASAGRKYVWRFL